MSELKLHLRTCRHESVDQWMGLSQFQRWCVTQKESFNNTHLSYMYDQKLATILGNKCLQRCTCEMDNLLQNWQPYKFVLAWNRIAYTGYFGVQNVLHLWMMQDLHVILMAQHETFELQNALSSIQNCYKYWFERQIK